MKKIIDRLAEYIDKKDISLNAFDKSLGASNGYIGKQIKNKASIGGDVIEKISCIYTDLSLDWLITGKEPMLRSGDLEIREFALKTDNKTEMQRIPLYDFEAVAGLVPLFNDTAKQVPIDYIQIPNLPKCDGAIHVVGDSMYPLLKSGDIVLYKWVRDVSFGIFWGEMYLVSVDFDGEEYVTVKYIQKSDQEGFIKLVSYNQHHGDKEIPVGTIRALAFVKASIRINSMK